MAITSLDGLVAAEIAGYRQGIARASIANTVAGAETSLWRGTGFPAQGGIPAATAICTDATTGALPLVTRTTGQDRIISQVALSQAALGHAIYIEDRLMHMGGLNGTLATAQTVSMDLNANLGNNNLAERVGKSDLSEVEWYLEWYTDTGGTSVTPTAQVTFTDATTASLNIWNLGGTTIPVTTRASRRYKIMNPTSGKIIKSVDTVTLSATTGTAGSFGVTCVRRLCVCSCILATALQVYDWSILGAPKVADSACLQLAQCSITTSSGVLHGYISQAVA